MDDCETEDMAEPVRLELASFLAEKGGTPMDITADLSAVAVAGKAGGREKGRQDPENRSYAFQQHQDQGPRPSAPSLPARSRKQGDKA